MKSTRCDQLTPVLLGSCLMFYLVWHPVKAMYITAHLEQCIQKKKTP